MVIYKHPLWTTYSLTMGSANRTTVKQQQNPEDKIVQKVNNLLCKHTHPASVNP